MPSKILVLDSITKLPRLANDSVAYCASHAGSFCAGIAIQSRLRAVVLNDAGVGLRQAGIAALQHLDVAAMPAAAIDHRSARIGDGNDGYRRGRISFVNAAAAELGVKVGDSCEDALTLLAHKAPPASCASPTFQAEECRGTERLENGTEIVLADSNSLVRNEDAGRVVVCGSHGGLLGGDPYTAVRVDVGAILFNDANFGADDAGISRLPALNARGIPAGCVSAWTACIGVARSSYDTGVVSALNEIALGKGAMLGMTAREFALQISMAKS